MASKSLIFAIISLVLLLFAFGCSQTKSAPITPTVSDPVTKTPNEPLTEYQEMFGCSSDSDCSYYYSYGCVTAINKNHPYVGKNIKEGPPGHTAACLDGESFSYYCNDKGLCRQKVNCSVICDIARYDEKTKSEFLATKCYATSEACNVYKDCNC